MMLPFPLLPELRRLPMLRATSPHSSPPVHPVTTCLPELSRFLTRPQLLTCRDPLPGGRDLSPSFGLLSLREYCYARTNREKGGTIMLPTQGRPWQSAVAISMVVVGLIVSVMLSVVQAGSGNPNPRVFPPTSHAYGNTYGEWSARSWQCALSSPVATNPALDDTGVNCAEGQSGQVWFLAGSFSGGFDRTCAVPHGRALLFAILNAAFGVAVGDCEPTKAGTPCDVTVLRADAAAALSLDFVEMEATLDDVPLRNLIAYHVQSPVFSVTLPSATLPELVLDPLRVGVPSGTYTPMVSDGFWLMLAPLSAGAHTLHYKGTVTGGPFDGFVIDGTYHLTIGP